MPAFFTATPPAAVEVFSVSARSILFRDKHMRSDPVATSDHVTVASNCLLVKKCGPDNELTVLCDSGPGLHLPVSFREKLGITPEDILMKNLGSLGVTPADIDVYLPSHLHWDHTGWAFENGEFKFPNAHVIMSRQAREDNARVSTENDMSFLPEVPAILDSLDRQDRLTLLDASSVTLTGPGKTIPMLGNGITFFFSRGHSEGQMHAIFSTTFGSMVFGGDFWPTAWHAQDPKRFMPQFDQRETEQLLAEKAAFLPRAARHGLYLHLYHDPKVIAVQVLSKGDSFELQDPLGEVRWTDKRG